MTATLPKLLADDIRDVPTSRRFEKGGKAFKDVFPRLNTIINTTTAGTFTVHFSKRQGAPVKFVAGDDPESVNGCFVPQCGR
ncbi:hypothetical protein [Phyllobacterium zundukense]|uniref:Uncharacterized protein n=1 Tax=Phyllobacterium zundukense TaxID=1867719 RepID=A0ACD4CWW1_9HYPH|nr:hypothetical protein [Phyllobacterium zundukense]UXN58102.1 hypothetical protein N8E88_04555 [Phyllobacterium zundukense]